MIKLANLLIVAGTGRNVGKTTFLCNLINKVSKYEQVIALKITPHMHNDCSHCTVIYKSEHCIISKETLASLAKDSSKMVAAGATEVFYIQVKDQYIKEGLKHILPLIKTNTAVVCESAALINFVTPGYFVLMSGQGQVVKNTHLAEKANLQVFNFEYDIENIDFVNGEWKG